MERVFAQRGAPHIRYEVSDIKVFRELALQTDALFLASAGRGMPETKCLVNGR